MKKYLVFLLSVILITLASCKLNFEDDYPEITNTAFEININKDYDIIQSSAITCNFVKDKRISEMKIIVEKVARLNWNTRFVILEDTTGQLYLYDMDTELLKQTNDYSIFLNMKEAAGVNLHLKSKNAFEKEKP